MTYEPVCLDCDGALTFSGVVWRHVEPGVGHAPMPRRTNREPEPEPVEDDWVLPE